ncbi:MAG: GNAT family N-acetyltransferase [Oscillospiraceae bacterium]|nr:GNAT family N-acetyltransferase [Oscillospiraceae bacterium]
MIELIHRSIDFERDRAYVLECHCRINYACDSPWARAIPYEEYRQNWFAMPAQISEFWQHLQESAKDPRAITEIIEDETDEIVAYLWAFFWENKEAKIACLELQDIYVEEAFRGQGVASQLFAYAEEKARAAGINLMRSGTGRENAASIAMHGKLGYEIYRYEFEKLLK